MGYATAAAFSETVKDGDISIERALEYHLTANFYPPLPAAYAAPLLEAIEAVNQDDGALLIALPEGIDPLPRTAEKIEGVWMVDADTLVDVCKAWPFTTPFND